MSFVVVRQGQAQITGGGQAFTLNADNSATLSGTDQLAYQIELAPQPDQFDSRCQERDAHEAQLASRRYLPPTVIGGEDLGDYGVWQETGQYGAVWYPQSVDPGWAPYHYGHWAWMDPWAGPGWIACRGDLRHFITGAGLISGTVGVGAPARLRLDIADL